MAGLVIVVSYAGFASPLVVLIAFAASMCCASSIAEFARRLPSAGSPYTYGSRGLGRAGGFLTGWMMVFAYALYVPAGIALTSAHMSQLLVARAARLRRREGATEHIGLDHLSHASTFIADCVAGTFAELNVGRR